MSSRLTPEDLQRIEENRKKALERLQSVRNKSGSISNSVTNINGNNQVNKFSPSSSSSTNNSSSLSSGNQINGSANIGNPKTLVFKSSPTLFYSKLTVQSNKNNIYKKPNDPKVKTWNVASDPVSGVCSLISRDRFLVEIPYNQKVIDIFKSIPGRQYDSKTKYWSFPLEEYEHLKNLMAPLSPGIVIGTIPKAILQTFLNIGQPVPRNEFKSINLNRIEKTLLDSLFPFQVEGVQFGISKQGRCMIADEMGLGKTIQALGIASYYYDDWPLLIVCPSSMRYQWEEEICKYLPNVPSYRIYVLNSKKDIVENPKVLILSYDLISKVRDYIKTLKSRFLILDESHSLKNLKTQRTKTALELAAKCKRCILLSGTPALSRPVELFPQIKALSSHLFKDLSEFGIRYCDGKQDKFGWNFNGSSNLEELRVLLEEKLLIRRLKSDVLDQLPSKIRQVVVLSSDKINLDDKVMKSFTKRLNQDSIKGKEKRSTLLSYYAETAKAKAKAICDHIEKILEQDSKFLLFAHHREVLDAVSDLLERREVYYIRIDGTVNSEERKAVCDQFQEEDKFRVALLSIKAASCGITLTAAQLIVFAELYWNPGELIQAEDRAHRIGQKESVLVQYLIAKGTADDYMWPLIHSKLSTLQKAGLSHDNKLSVNTSKNSDNQPKITTFFQQMFDEDDGIDDDDLTNLLDEIEGVPEKKMKTSI